MARFLDDDDETEFHQGHTFMASNNNLLSDNNWIFNTEATCLIVNNKEVFTNYISLIKLRIFNTANKTSLTIYNIETVRIHMQQMNVFVKDIYYISNIVANLICIHRLFISNYWTES